MKSLTSALLSLSLAYATSAQASASLHIGERQIELDGKRLVEPTFRDEQGREVYLRGWNVSGSVKLTAHGFKPFDSREDAAKSFESMKRHTGANLVRFTVAWEGTNPHPDEIDYAYVDAIIEQMREAIRQQIYVFVDFHTDLYSRYLFQPDSPHTGNGAPEWIIAGGQYPPSNCGAVCFAWSQHIVFDPAIRLGYRNFFDNASVNTPLGERHVQDAFLWQMHEVLAYIKGKLTPQEFEWVTGVQPFNEPIYGYGHKNRADEFDNQKLWPFYQRTRAVLNDTGWTDKWVFAEPMVFWDTNAGFYAPPTGGHYLKNKPGAGFVFAPHFYDAARMGVTNLGKVYNGEYFKNIDSIRNEARFLGIPAVLGEFGMWLKDQKGGARDHARIVNGTYQALESSDIEHVEKNRRPDFYTSLVSGTQWHWDIYKDSHREYQNGNLRKLRTQGDAWNGEDFSVIKGDTLTVDANGVQRAFPLTVDGNIVSFYFNSMAVDGAGKTLDWAEIRSGENSYFGNSRFTLLVWQGGSHSTSEIFLPASFTPGSTSLVTDSEVKASLAEDTRYQAEFNTGVTGYRLALSSRAAASSDALHFALIANTTEYNEASLQTLRTDLIDQLAHHEHPVYLRGKMAGLNYPEVAGEQNTVTLNATENHFLVFRWVKLSWKAKEQVTVLQKGKPVLTGNSNGTATLLSFIGAKDTFKVCEKNSSTHCSRMLQFD